MSGREKWIRQIVGWGAFGGGLVLAGAIYVGSTRTISGADGVKELSNALQIQMALRAFAEDHLGNYPNSQTGGAALLSSNQAFNRLIPDYLADKKLFYSRHSMWSLYPPDLQAKTGTPLKAGENCFAYVPGQTLGTHPKFPLIAMAFAKGIPGTYPINSRVKWTVIVRSDGSGRLEKVSSSDGRIYGSDGNGNKIDLFKPAPDWLAADQVPLNPE